MPRLAAAAAAPMPRPAAAATASAAAAAAAAFVDAVSRAMGIAEPPSSAPHAVSVAANLIFALSASVASLFVFWPIALWVVTRSTDVILRCFGTPSMWAAVLNGAVWTVYTGVLFRTGDCLEITLAFLLSMVVNAMYLFGLYGYQQRYRMVAVLSLLVVPPLFFMFFAIRFNIYPPKGWQWFGVFCLGANVWTHINVIADIFRLAEPRDYAVMFINVLPMGVLNSVATYLMLKSHTEMVMLTICTLISSVCAVMETALLLKRIYQIRNEGGNVNHNHGHNGAGDVQQVNHDAANVQQDENVQVQIDGGAGNVQQHNPGAGNVQQHNPGANNQVQGGQHGNGDEHEADVVVQEHDDINPAAVIPEIEMSGTMEIKPSCQNSKIPGVDNKHPDNNPTADVTSEIEMSGTVEIKPRCQNSKIPGEGKGRSPPVVSSKYTFCGPFRRRRALLDRGMSVDAY